MIWFGLLFFNLFLAQDSVEDFFKLDSKNTLVVQTEFCINQSSFEKEKECGHVLMAFFGGTSGFQSSNDQKLGLSLLFETLGALRVSDELIKTQRFWKFNHTNLKSARAPPLV